ncbi:MAG TPA: DoxX family protein [Planctomycetota bacterium]|nr:DoxX family protein [Planctomycetota bacterium]
MRGGKRAATIRGRPILHIQTQGTRLVFVVPVPTADIRTGCRRVSVAMDMIASCRRRAPCAENLARDAAGLLTRLTIGQAFAQAGLGKLTNLEGVIEYFASLGIPLARVQAPTVATLEFVGGIALILGLATRAVAFLLAGTMAVALVTAHRSEFAAALRWSPEEGLTGIDPWMYGLALLWLMAAGPGRLSLDRAVLAWWRRRRGKAMVAPAPVSR